MRLLLLLLLLLEEWVIALVLLRRLLDKVAVSCLLVDKVVEQRVSQLEPVIGDSLLWLHFFWFYFFKKQQTAAG